MNHTKDDQRPSADSELFTSSQFSRTASRAFEDEAPPRATRALGVANASVDPASRITSAAVIRVISWAQFCLANGVCLSTRVVFGRTGEPKTDCEKFQAAAGAPASLARDFGWRERPTSAGVASISCESGP